MSHVEIDHESRLVAALEAALAFKRWVHGWLDANGVPADSEPEHTAATGCRISGRMRYLLEMVESAKGEVEALRSELAKLRGQTDFAQAFCASVFGQSAKDCSSTAVAAEVLRLAALEAGAVPLDSGHILAGLIKVGCGRAFRVIDLILPFTDDVLLWLGNEAEDGPVIVRKEADGG